VVIYYSIPINLGLLPIFLGYLDGLNSYNMSYSNPQKPHCFGFKIPADFPILREKPIRFDPAGWLTSNEEFVRDPFLVAGLEHSL
jgi:hypothetical protein